MTDTPHESNRLRILLALAILALLGYLAYGFDAVHEEPLRTDGVAVYSGVAGGPVEGGAGFVLHELRNEDFRVYGTKIPPPGSFVVLEGRYHEGGTLEVADPEHDIGWDPYWKYKKYGSLLALLVVMIFVGRRYRFDWRRGYLLPRGEAACRT